MKTSFLSFGLFLLSIFSFAQTSVNNRVSPPDTVRVKTLDNVVVEIDYSRPFLKGREIGTNIVPFGKVWRTGANEATVFEINHDVLINEEQVLKAGKYSLYTIPNEESVIVIFNRDWDQWGTKYNETEDALRVEVPSFTAENSLEQFTIFCDEYGQITLHWGNFEFCFQLKKAEETQEVAKSDA